MYIFKNDKMTWYRNEMGYTYTLVDHVVKAGRLV